MKEALRVLCGILVYIFVFWPITLGILLHDIYNNIFIDIISAILAVVYIFYIVAVKDNKLMLAVDAILKKSKFFRWLNRTD